MKEFQWLTASKLFISNESLTNPSSIDIEIFFARLPFWKIRAVPQMREKIIFNPLNRLLFSLQGVNYQPP
jgi:hypothetical protein